MKNLGSVVDDTIMYGNNKYPFFVPQSTVDNVWYDLAYKDVVVINNVRYSPTRRPLFYILRSGDVVLAQRIRRYIESIEDYGHGLQIWWYLNKAKESNITPDQLWSYPNVDTIINWDIYFAPDTTIIDTIDP